MSNENISELDKKRHSLAHLTAAAVKTIWPEAKNAIGPAVENGFYQDFEMPTPISDKDLPKIEKEMKKILKDWKSFDGRKASADEAKEVFTDNKYKVEMVDDITERGEDITIYTSGEFVDLCRGGHFDDLSSIDPDTFELERVAGAYWKNDENNIMLTRIYGLAFDSKEELEEHKRLQEEAKERDHRKIGKEMGLFTFSELVGAGLPLFTPKGNVLRESIVAKVQELEKPYGYKRVWIPHITKPDLYKTSGHWEKFGDELFKVKGKESEFVMKPMNCPHHTQIFDSEQRSYRDMPLRFSETTAVYRDEQSGELQGLGRVRSITQDDAHIFCTEDQIEEEAKAIVDIIRKFYTLLDMWKEGNFWVSLSARDPQEPDKYLGEPELWEKAEAALEKVAKDEGLPYKRVEGEAAFYGPKLDFQFKDAIGRERQLGTVQLDFNMPGRFGLEYVDSDGSKKTPVMIHRAIAGSLERFLSVMIEHFAGNFPFWMAPTQVKVLPIADAHLDKAKDVADKLNALDIRVDVDTSSDGFGKKVRNAKVEKVPYFVIIGDKDIEVGKVTLESRDNGNLGQLSDDELIEKLVSEK